MTIRSIQEQWQDLRQRLDADADKFSQDVVLELSREYSRLSAADRTAVDELLAKWLLSPDEKMRFDALALIFDHNIASTLPALERLAERLQGLDDPSARYELAKVRRLTERLKAS